MPNVDEYQPFDHPYSTLSFSAHYYNLSHKCLCSILPLVISHRCSLLFRNTLWGGDTLRHAQ